MKVVPGSRPLSRDTPKVNRVYSRPRTILHPRFVENHSAVFVLLILINHQTNQPTNKPANRPSRSLPCNLVGGGHYIITQALIHCLLSSLSPDTAGKTDLTCFNSGLGKVLNWLQSATPQPGGTKSRPNHKNTDK